MEQADLTPDPRFDEQDELNLLLHELGHAIAYADAGAAFVSITTHETDTGPIAKCLGYEISRSGPQPMESTGVITAAGAAFTFLFEFHDDAWPTHRKLQVSAASLIIMGELGIRAEADWASADETPTPEIANAGMTYFMLAVRHERQLLEHARQLLPEFRAGKRINLIGEHLREWYLHDQMAFNMVRYLPQMLNDQSSLRSILHSLQDEPVQLPDAQRPAPIQVGASV